MKNTQSTQKLRVIVILIIFVSLTLVFTLSQNYLAQHIYSKFSINLCSLNYGKTLTYGVENSSYWKLNRDTCYIMHATRFNDWESCTRITTDFYNGQAYCLSQISKQTNSYLCDKSTRTEERKYCFSDIIANIAETYNMSGLDKYKQKHRINTTNENPFTTYRIYPPNCSLSAPDQFCDIYNPYTAIIKDNKVEIVTTRAIHIAGVKPRYYNDGNIKFDCLEKNEPPLVLRAYYSDSAMYITSCSFKDKVISIDYFNFIFPN